MQSQQSDERESRIWGADKIGVMRSERLVMRVERSRGQRRLEHGRPSELKKFAFTVQSNETEL